MGVVTETRISENKAINLIIATSDLLIITKEEHKVNGWMDAMSCTISISISLGR